MLDEDAFGNLKRRRKHERCSCGKLLTYGVFAGGTGLMVLSTPKTLSEGDEIAEAASHGIQRVASAC